MNPAEVATALVIERTLQDSPAYRKVDDALYVIKQGSAYVMISVVPWGKHKAMVRCTAQLVKGVELTGGLAAQLLELNAHLRFGAFAWEPADETVLFTHTILGGTTLDADELMATVSDVALIADEYDDKLMKKYGGQRMVDLLEEAALERIVDRDPDRFDFGGS
ncbi:MAG: YbjN domain-containing protein [Kofleriaceae bacterium]